MEWARAGRCVPRNDPQAATEFTSSNNVGDQARAKLVCVDCPVRVACLSWALDHAEIWDVWGGLDEGELRRALSVDARGHFINRCRAPHCPQCRARPSVLTVVGYGRQAVIECGACAFSWRSPTSATAVRSYQRARRQAVRQRSVERRVAARDEPLLLRE